MNLVEGLIISISLMFGLALHGIAQVALIWWVLKSKASSCGKKKTASPRWDRRIPRQHS